MNDSISDSPALPEEQSYPPVPGPLREALKDYPEHLAELQGSLARFAVAPGMSKDERADLLQSAYWALEGGTGDFMSKARGALTEAEESGDAAKIEEKQKVFRLMQTCRGPVVDRCWDDLEAFYKRGG